MFDLGVWWFHPGRGVNNARYLAVLWNTKSYLHGFGQATAKFSHFLVFFYIVFLNYFLRVVPKKPPNTNRNIFLSFLLSHWTIFFRRHVIMGFEQLSETCKKLPEVGFRRFWELELVFIALSKQKISIFSKRQPKIVKTVVVHTESTALIFKTVDNRMFIPRRIRADSLHRIIHAYL